MAPEEYSNKDKIRYIGAVISEINRERLSYNIENLTYNPSKRQGNEIKAEITEGQDKEKYEIPVKEKLLPEELQTEKQYKRLPKTTSRITDAAGVKLFQGASIAVLLFASIRITLAPTELFIQIMPLILLAIVSTAFSILFLDKYIRNLKKMEISPSEIENE